MVSRKLAGAAPGFTIRDAGGDVWFVSFDAAGHPEAATGAIMVANKIFWALGYWQVENHLVTLAPANLTISEEAKFTPPSGRERRMERRDLDDVFARAHRSADGTYRAVAARAVPGRPVGGFRYHGTRPDDPNDVVPHEHRRELRALKVFGAWTNLSDMKAGNTLDTVVTENGRSVVRHYLQDVGSTFGTGANGPHDYDEGWETLFDRGLTRKRLVRLGFVFEPWLTAPYVEHPAIGRFEGDRFDPEGWQPRVAPAAFLRARADDNFWAARRVAAFTDEMIRAAVRAGGYSDPAAAALLADVLIEAPAQDRGGVSPGGQPADRLHPVRRWPSALPQRGRRRACRPRAGRRVHGELGRLRQPHGRDPAAGAGHHVPLERHCRAAAAAVGGRRIRAGPGRGGRARSRRMDAAGRCLFPTGRRWLASRRARQTSLTLEPKRMQPQSKYITPAIAAALVLGLFVGLEAMDVKVEHNKTFDFKAVRTWAWNPKGAGDVIMARTQEDDAAAMKGYVDPLIRDAVATGLMGRLQPAAAQPDVTVTYYLLLNTNISSQTVGQFLPATTAWGIPPFPQATQSLKVMNQGSLVLDLTAQDVVVWRGVAQAQIKPDAPTDKRESLLREAVRDLLKRYPPKQ